VCSSIQYRRCCGDLRPSVRLLSSVARFPRFSRAPAKVMVCSRSALTPVGSREHTVEAQKNRRGLEMRGGGGTGWSEWKEAKGGGGARGACGSVHHGCDHRGERFYVRRRRERGNREAARGGKGEKGASGLSPESESERAPRERAFVPPAARDLGAEGGSGGWARGRYSCFHRAPCPRDALFRDAEAKARARDFATGKIWF